MWGHWVSVGALGQGVSVGWGLWGHQEVSVGSSCCGVMEVTKGICGVIGWWGVWGGGHGVMGSPRGVSGVMEVTKGNLKGHWVVGCLWGGGYGVMGSPRGTCGVVMLWGVSGVMGVCGRRFWSHGGVMGVCGAEMMG